MTDYVGDALKRAGRKAKKQTSPKPNGRADIAITADDFYAYLPMHAYLFVPTREMWPSASINTQLGEINSLKASIWLDLNRQVHQMSWVPGEPMLIKNRLFVDGGWHQRPGLTCFNLYREPDIILGDPRQATPWLNHIKKIYPEDATHIVMWCAHRRQKPYEKINHALVLGGGMGIGKDTLLEPLKVAVGRANFNEVSPTQLLGRFNGFLKSVVLRVNEARDLGEINRFQFYDHTKWFTAAPPDALRIDEKNIREYNIPNCCGVIITTNHKADGIFLPADDRRHYVAWSDATKEEFTAAYWDELWAWYERGGFKHVAAYLQTLNLHAFNAKSPPPKTRAFWDIVAASASPDDVDFLDALDRLANPSALTLDHIKTVATGDLVVLLNDRKNRRAIPYRLEACGYVPVRSETKDGHWVVNGKRQVIYAKQNLNLHDQIAAARAMVNASDR